MQVELSMVLLMAGILLHRRSPARGAYTIAALLASSLSLLLLAAHFVADYFTADGINEAALYHLRYGLAGAGFAEYGALIGGAIVATALAIGGIFLVLRSRSAGGRFATAAGNPVSLALVCASVALQPAAAAMHAMLPGAPQSRASQQPGAGALHAEFNRYYAQPAAVAAGASRNVVYIYAESLERTYFDESLFPGLVTRLRALEKQAVSFTAIEELPWTGWTMAGMVASQCGIPLVTPSDGEMMSKIDRFLPGATCLGDLLQRDGYHLVYNGGAAMRFAGKGRFYESHGFAEVAGRAELRSRVADAEYVSSWGLYDDTLFDLAAGKFAELARAKKKFGLFLLTLDTHHPDGHVSASCRSMPYRDGANPILNAVRCSDHLIGEFVDRIRATPGGADTVIVIASDHLAMRNSAHDLLTRKARRNLFMVLDPRQPDGRQVATPGSTLDVGPTLMAFLGYDASLGLGRNLLRADADAAARAAFIKTRLMAWHAPLSAFWHFPRIEQYLEVDAENFGFGIDGRHAFALPSFIEMDDELQTVIRFPGGEISAMEYVRRNGEGRAFLLLADCKVKDHRLPARLCLFAGQGKQIRAQLMLDRAARFSRDEIRRMTGARS